MYGIESVADQVTGLRRIVEPAPIRVLAVTSGKGGVGKTNVSVNLSIAMAGQGKSVLLMDADLGLGNVDVLLGLHPERNLSHVIDGRCTLEEVIVSGPGNIKLVPASSGVTRMAVLDPAEHAGLIRAFSDLALGLDALVVDTAAGIAESVLRFSSASQEILVVVCDEPASITDAYALIKTLHREHGRHRFRIVANMVRSTTEGQTLFLKLLKVCDRFLDVSLDFMGSVPFDELVHKSVKRQRAVVDAFPGSRAAAAFKKLATAADNWSVREQASGYLEFFAERLFQSAHDHGRTAQ